MLSPLHRWFHLFEHGKVAPVSRVVAAGTAALITAAGLGAVTRTRWWAHLPLAVAVWALLGKVEGDARDAVGSDDSTPGRPPHPLGGVREPRGPTPPTGSGTVAAPEDVTPDPLTVARSRLGGMPEP